jgi:hypothetical protein
MWQRTFTKIYFGIKKEHIWALWTDVNNWPKWHGDLEYCTLVSRFEVGNYFMLKPKGVGAVKIMLVDIQDHKQFTDCTTFWGAKMYDTHYVEELADGSVKLTNHLVVTGWLKWLWITLVAKKVADTVPGEMEALVSLARSMNEK